MKTLSFLLLILFIANAMAQSPQGIKYQAIVRSDNGTILQNHEIEFKILILKNDGTVIYSETHSLQSNSFGLVNFSIGQGQVLQGDFASVNWEESPLSIKTEFRVDGNTDFSDLGTSPLMSVPYAFYAEKAGSATETDPDFNNSVASFIDSDNINNWNLAYQWGDHAQAGYLSSFSESDPNSWKTNGNSNTTNQFLGTTDSAALSLRTFNSERMRISANGTVQIGSSINNNQTALSIGASDGKGVVFVGGNSSPIETPVSGGGKRMMWYPYKAAFRVGEVSGNLWDKDSIGVYSFAAGFNNSSKGNFSNSFGYQNKAQGIMTFVAGRNNAINAYLSNGFGEYLKTEAYGSFAIGRYNAVLGNPDTWVNSDPLFIVGNGSGENSRANAMIVLKNSNTAIGIAYPNVGNQLEVGRLGYGGNIVFNGSSAGSPDTLCLYSGHRMVWLPKKGAFRAGEDANGTHWMYSKMGDFSAAFGSSTMAQGNYSFATGNNTQANAYYSISLGLNNTSSGTSSSTFNSNNTAIANNSTCFGFNTKTSSYSSMAMGRFNTYNEANNTNTWLSYEPLLIAGNGTGDASRSNALVLYKSGNMTISGTLTQSSDIRLKTNIQPLRSTLSDLEKVQPISYQFKDKECHPSGPQIGFSAQEIQKLWPELVREDENGFLSVDYAGMTVILLQSIKEQQTQIQNLQKEIQQLKHQ